MKHVYEVRPRKDNLGVDLISGNAIGYAEHYSRSHQAVIRVYDESGRFP
jgi:hypothetical protein